MTSQQLLLTVDTETTLTIDPVATDNVINGAEAAAGVTISGTGEPGATVVVDPEGSPRSAVVGEDGTWSVTYGAGEVDGGTYDATLTVVATDALGNSTTSSTTIHVDTETSVTVGAIATDNVVDGTEAASGVTLGGTGEAGATVTVELGGVTKTATVAEDGTWTAAFAPGEIAGGEYDAPVTVTATDAHGNSATATASVHVDTQTTVALDGNQAGGDDLVTAAEAAAGVTLTGTAEAGASVAVTVEGVTRTATAGSDGTWAATFEAGHPARRRIRHRCLGRCDRRGGQHGDNLWRAACRHPDRGFDRRRTGWR